jgi:molybdopterin-guanine dinucleotide biosynthesis protein A
MIKLGGMLMIGSGGRNVGKTSFACELIKRHCATNDIIAVKVTTISDGGGSPGAPGCPRGGEGCGVCASLDGGYVIMEETQTGLDKDTSRLLAAGAKKVLWLRVRSSWLDEAAEALASAMGVDSISICESNSLRLAVEPGGFIMLQRAGSDTYKRSAEAVKRYAERIIYFDGSTFDLRPEQITLARAGWIVPLRATAIILAGGPSRRMGTDKALLPIGSRCLIEHLYNQLLPWFDGVLISAAETDKYAFLGARVVADEVPGCGPLGGIASGLATSDSEANFVIACDVPAVDMNFVKNMLSEARDCDAVIPRWRRGYEPLFAVYKKSALPAVRSVLAGSGRRIIEILPLCRVKVIDMGEASWYTNINTMADYEAYTAKYTGKV